MKLKQNSRIGIWGYGIVGKAVLHYFQQEGYRLSIMDTRKLSADEQKELSEKNIHYYHEDNKNQFFTSHDYFFSSSGVNIVNDYPTHKGKWLHELDIFFHDFKKPIIAVTGSIGKTSITTILTSLLNLARIPACTGGNIGIATFDLLAQKDLVNYALLEVSSFQLEYCSKFAPHLAIITNIHPNHLDRHGTQENYFLAKYNILAHQTKNDHALIHFSLREKVMNKPFKSSRSFFGAQKPADYLLAQLTKNESVYYCDSNTIMRYHNAIETSLLSLTTELQSFSFLENIVLITAACNILNIPINTVLTIPSETQLPAHRLELVATINGIDFYNDSKSTTTSSTLAAVEKLHHRPLHLLLGGLSKGVNREPLITQLKTMVKHIYCFGKEATELHMLCKKHTIPSQQFLNLTDAFKNCIQNSLPGDIILLSPAGSSYDLYDNFEQRGEHFKQLVKNNMQ